MPAAVSYNVADGLTVGLEQLWPLVLLPVVVAALSYLTLWSDSDDARSASDRSRRLLLASRVFVACLLVFGAMGPYTIQARETPGEPEVTLVTDGSDSMMVYPDATEALAADIEEEGAPVSTVRVGNGSSSPIGDGVAANLQENGTVVVVSDGQVTEGRGLAVAADEARRLNATIHAVELEANRTERAVAIEGPGTLTAGVEAEFTVRLRGTNVDEPVPVEARIDGENITTQEIDDNGAFTVSKTFNETGTHRVTATIEGGDVFARNDVFHRSVRVVEQPEVLYVADGDYPLEGYLDELYDVTRASSVPPDLDDYAAVVVQDVPASEMGDVGALQEFVVGGGGLVVVGGENAYENGGYNRSSLAPVLPVRVGNATGGAASIVLVVDISGSTQRTFEIQKATALDVIEDIDGRHQVGIVAYTIQPYRIADLQRLEGNRDELADKIRRLENGGATDTARGLQGAGLMLGDRQGTVILLSDGQDDPDQAAVVARQLQRDGNRVIAVGTGENVDAEMLKAVADASGGTYLRADDTTKLELLFSGGGGRSFEGENLTVVSRDTFITSGLELSANPGKANEVQVKQGADYQVATAEGTPAVASWRFGLGRVATVTAYDEAGTLDGLLEQPDSLLTTRTVNYAVGDPTRTMTGVTTVDDTRVGTRTAVRYRGETPPETDEVTFRQLEEGLYRGEITPEEAGYQRTAGTEYAVNYPLEYGTFGTSSELSNAVSSTDGRTFDADEGSRIADVAKERSTKVRSVRDSWAWLPLLLGLLVFVLEVVTRRVQVYRGRTLLESGLP
ncbi:VWA domain-containing protein [Natronomonas marina]|jgi:hypothetical protein|uniref:VWA domain-containing protein n=1 Tax=Natronomonas marina TaxID=2961939 RepID=UPI0020CA00DD|nr:VWA domain-containing protein [Natronomonas marina]